jgi:hypothetical protein
LGARPPTIDPASSLISRIAAGTTPYSPRQARSYRHTGLLRSQQSCFSVPGCCPSYNCCPIYRPPQHKAHLLAPSNTVISPRRILWISSDPRIRGRTFVYIPLPICLSNLQTCVFLNNMRFKHGTLAFLIGKWSSPEYVPDRTTPRRLPATSAGDKRAAKLPLPCQL